MCPYWYISKIKVLIISACLCITSSFSQKLPDTYFRSDHYFTAGVAVITDLPETVYDEMNLKNTSSAALGVSVSWLRIKDEYMGSRLWCESYNPAYGYNYTASDGTLVGGGSEGGTRTNFGFGLCYSITIRKRINLLLEAGPKIYINHQLENADSLMATGYYPDLYYNTALFGYGGYARANVNYKITERFIISTGGGYQAGFRELSRLMLADNGRSATLSYSGTAPVFFLKMIFAVRTHRPH